MHIVALKIAIVKQIVGEVIAISPDGSPRVLRKGDERFLGDIIQTAIDAKVRIVVDDGEVDDKIVAVPADDRNNGNSINSLEDVPNQLIKQIEFHFNHYKDMKKPGTTKVESWGDIDEAKSVVKDAISRWNNR